jgi:murein DD-endopeptidase MepM/ murein hydrolase activator NlpD
MRVGSATTAPAPATAPPATARLPPPPSMTSCSRLTIAAMAAGAAIAAGESLVASLEARPAAQDAGPLVPVTQVASSPPGSEETSIGVGGDQPAPQVLASADLDSESLVDVQNLAKAVDIGRELARQAAIIESALADGAPEAALFGETAVVRPMVGRLTSAAGPRWGRNHNGLDIANRIGIPIFAVTDGVVVESGPATGFGLWVVLRHHDGTKSVYGHINRSFVRVGQRVAAGQQIAEVGNRGYSTGPHLHLEIWDRDGTKVNPATWFSRRGLDI